MRFLLFLISIAVALSAPSSDCARCHRAISENYRKTPMAMSSGETAHNKIEQFNRATFNHAGFQYRVSSSYNVSFEKAGGGLAGTKAMTYFVGSGATARSYLLAADGFLYESPAAWYSARAAWDLAPGYKTYAYPFLTRPVLPGCLTCHASFLQPIASTQNGFQSTPFREGGVACERCHGPGEAHIASGGQIVNPAKLSADRRDSICAQCHLLGEARVMRAGADWQSFHPGDRLSDSMTVFVRAGDSSRMRVTSHVEKLAQSACKRAAGDRLWCGTCHDPHSLPNAPERAAWFRTKCLGCHETARCKETAAARARRQDDCTACHMPKDSVADAEHVVYTDHSIPRRPIPRGSAAASAELVPFGPAGAPRDLALAYAITGDRTRALALLEAAARTTSEDVEVLVYLAEIYRNNGQDERAVPIYQRALKLDPAQLTACVGLGAIHFQRGEYAEAIRLWKVALTQNPGLVLTGTNLAMAQSRVGDRQAAESALRKIIELSPAFQPAQNLMRSLGVR